MRSEGYTLDLYCDVENEAHEWREFPHQYFGELGSNCRKRARRDGWLLGDKDVCPKCNAQKKAMNNH